MAILTSDSNRNSSFTFSKGKRFIFAIGIDKYQYCNILYNAVQDAKEVVEILTSKYQFEKADVTTLYNAVATRRNIYKHLDSFIEQITPNDTLLIYFSGHGKYIASHDEGFWIPVEGQSDDTSSFISNSDIVTRIRAIKAFHIVVISDSCFSGSLFGMQRRDTSIGLQKQEAIASRWLFTSGRNTPVSDGLPGKNSPFADNLLYHLRENKEPILPLTELSRFTTDAVANNSEQIPRCEPMKDVKHRGGEFMFRLKGVLPNAVEAEIQSVDIPTTPSVRDDISPTPIPFWLKWGKMLWLGASVISVVIISVFIIKNYIEKNTIPSETSNKSVTKDSSVEKGKEHLTGKETQSENIKNDPKKDPIPPKQGGKAKGTEGEDKIKIKTTSETNRSKSSDTGTNNPDLPIEDEPQKMCPIYCETNGISDVEVSFTVNNKLCTKKSVNSSQRLKIDDIPCKFTKTSSIAVTFRKKGKPPHTDNFQWDAIQIPDSFKD